MNLLDDAIKQHLELKRKRGTPPDEVERLEREVFGSAQGEEAPGPEQQHAGEEPESASAGQAPDSSSPESHEAPIAEPAIEDAETRHEPDYAGAQPPTPAEEPAAQRLPEDEDVEPFDLDDIFAEGPGTAPESEAEAGSPPASSDPPTEEHSPLASPDDEEEAEHSEEWEIVEAAEASGPERGEESAAWEAPSEEFDAPSEEFESPSEEFGAPSEEEDPFAPTATEPGTDEEDVLEETPEFLKESPQEDELWFEQTPPKDFDFDD